MDVLNIVLLMNSESLEVSHNGFNLERGTDHFHGETRICHVVANQIIGTWFNSHCNTHILCNSEIAEAFRDMTETCLSATNMLLSI